MVNKYALSYLIMATGNFFQFVVDAGDNDSQFLLMPFLQTSSHTLFLPLA